MRAIICYLTLLMSLAPAARAQLNPATYSGMRWRLIGPYRSGNVYAVAGIPGDPTTYYIGTPEGGVWKTTDAGTVWHPIFDQEHVPSIGAVVVAPSSPRIVYVGTGNPSFWSFSPGAGVFKSTDGGETWQSLGLADTRYITSMIVDPHNPNIVLVGALGDREFGQAENAARGVYRSTDGGRTWAHVLTRDAHTGVGGMTTDYRDPRIIYVALQRTPSGFAAPRNVSQPPMGSSIYKSTDEGATWHPVSSRGLPSTAQSFLIAVAPGTHGQRVYAEAQGQGRDATGLFRSDDGGASWSLMTTRLLSAGGGPLYVDPQNPDVLYLMGTAMYRSVDGGRHVVAYKGSPGGDDPRDLWIDPTNSRRMLMGVDQGPTISVDGGLTWTPWYNLPNGQFYHVSTDSLFPYHVCGAQQDSGTACVASRSDFGEIRDNDWYPVGGFEDGYIVSDPLDPRWIFTQGWYHVLRRYDRETGQMAVLYTPSATDRFSNAPPLAFSPENARLLYMGAQYVLASSDGAHTWQRISPDLTLHTQPADSGGRPAPSPRFRATITTLAPSTVKAGEIWVGTNSGVIQLTQDGGTTWKDVTPPTMPSGAFVAVPIIDASHTDPGTAYAAVQAFRDDHPYIFRTTDYGQHWQLIVNGISPDASVRVVREDPVQPRLLFAGTENAAWVSFDRGDHWQSLQLNLPNTVVSDMTVHGSDLAISTYGRGLWILDDLTPLRQATAVAETPRPYLVDPAPAYRVRWDNIEDTPLPPEVANGENPPEGAILDYYLPSAASGAVTLSIRDAQGHLIREYSSVAPPPDTIQPNIAPYWFERPIVLSTAAGHHRINWDLRYPPPSVINYSYFGDLLDYREYTLNTHAVPGRTPVIQPAGPLVVPGAYQISLAVGGQTYTRQLTVLNDPRVQMSPQALEAQLQLQLEMMAGLRVSYDQFNQMQRLRATLAADSAQAGRDSAVMTAIRGVDGQLASAASAAETGMGPANRDLTRTLEDMESGDVDPTPSDRAAVARACAQIDSASALLAHLQSADGRRLDEQLRGAKLTGLSLEAVPTGPACRIEGASAASR